MKTRQRPKKLKCKPGYEQRGAACQRINRLNRDEPTSQSPKKRWSKRKILAATVGAYVAASVATAVGVRAAWGATANLREQKLQNKAYDHINGEKSNSNLSKKLRDFEDSIKDNHFETMGVFDSEGNTILNKPGEQYQVGLSIPEVHKILGASIKGKGVILTHNHPKVLGDYAGSFSLQDAKTACALQVKQIRAVTGEEVFTLSPAKGDRFTPELSKKIQDAYNKREFEMVQIFHSRVILGMDASEANMRGIHDVWEGVAKDVPEIKYEKIARGNARYVRGYSK